MSSQDSPPASISKALDQNRVGQLSDTSKSAEDLKRIGTPLPSSIESNVTYKRAIEAFFTGGEISEDQLQQLPQEVGGLSEKRKQTISAVKEARSERETLSALAHLRQTFGLPPDLHILYLALTPDHNHMNIEALRVLKEHLETNELGAWEERIRERLRSLEVRSFNPHITQGARACLNLI